MSISRIDAHNHVKDMADAIIYAKKAIGVPKSLLLVGGDKDQPFYRSIIRAANAACVVRTEWSKELDDAAYTDYDGILFDTGSPISSYDLSRIKPTQDIDCLTQVSKFESSCVAAACYCLLNQLELLSGTHVVIIGRSNAAKGLAKLCIKENATVTVIHSKTPTAIIEMLTNYSCMADVVINTAPNIEGSRLPAHTLIIDVANSYNSAYFGDAAVFTGIGPLTAALVVGRL